MNNYQGIYDLLKSEWFRRRPALYIGKLSLFRLESFIEGYFFALNIHGVENTEREALDGFNDFVAAYYNRTPVAGWANNIWAENYGDEEQSYKDFFMLFDRFLGQEKDPEFYCNLMLMYRGKIAQADLLFE